ncbi:MAG: NTPase [Actinobacteria bacterium]|nr:NTPase [Actinomycetota bacterium]
MDEMTASILLKGRPGSGKTTLVVALAEALARGGWRVCGFVTEEIREGGSRIGFRVRDFDGAEAVLSHVSYRGMPRVGRYGVDVAAFESVALPALEEGRRHADLLVVDEVGRMETISAAFRELFMDLAEGETPLLATIPCRGDPYILALLEIPGVDVFEVTAKNRCALGEVIEGRLKDVLSARKFSGELEGGIRS